MPSENPTTRAWSIAAIPVALASIPFLTNAPDLRHWRALVGYALLAVAGLIPVVAWAVARRAAGKRQRKIRRGRVITRHLITQGDRLHHDPGIIPAATDTGSGTFTIITRGERPSPVERWRETVGEKLNHSPFKPGTGDWALTQTGNRISDVLDRLRKIEADLERWIEDN